jgi:hypothetical protein
MWFALESFAARVDEEEIVDVLGLSGTAMLERALEIPDAKEIYKTGNME